MRGHSTSIKQRWIRFERPAYAEEHSRSGSVKRKASPNEYYARVRLNGVWGCGYGSGGGGGGGRYRRRYRSTLKVTFPEHQGRFAELLDKARMQDYRVGPSWFQAAETHGKPGRKALREATVRESELMKVFDAWARHRYRLGQAFDAESAWAALARICEEADTVGEYATDSVAGRATELLTPILDPAKLVDCAETLIKRYHHWPGSFSYAKRYGRQQFSVGQPRGYSGKRIPPSAAGGTREP